MQDLVRIQLQPLGEVFEVPRGTPLQDILFAHGVEFPCGGHARCKGCRIKVLTGNLPETDRQKEALTGEELAQGWRLACQCKADENLTLEIMQWESTVLADHSTFEFTPREGLGIAVDLGTTTIVAQLVHLASAHVLAVKSALNPQAKFGSDIMSRVNFAVHGAGREKLEKIIRNQIGNLIVQLMDSTPITDPGVKKVVIAGNTVMHHIFSGIDLKPLSHYPFEPEKIGRQTFTADELGWKKIGSTPVHFLPCLGSFVGSDILAGILATNIHQSKTLACFIDLGTNAEIVIGNRDRILCASAAAGPAFEAAKISMGMRASTGAISAATVEDGQLSCHVLGYESPRGICGSGLVDAVAAGLDLGIIENSGRLANSKDKFMLLDPVHLTQNDIRELQLAKGAIAAGLKILLKQWPAGPGDIKNLYLAGAFGNYINRESACRIGLLNLPIDKIQPAGNTALMGAKLALFLTDDQNYNFAPVTQKIEHVSLAADPNFQDIFVNEMIFPTE